VFRPVFAFLLIDLIYKIIFTIYQQITYDDQKAGYKMRDFQFDREARRLEEMATLWRES
jgi:uncharacterized protein with LGFP repeats